MSLVTAFKSAIKGEYVADKVYEQRLATCRGCNFLRGQNCIKCTCFVKIKNWFPDEECPMGKWNKAEPADKPELVVDEAVVNEAVDESGEIVVAPAIDPIIEQPEPKPDNSILGKIKKVFKRNKK